jgi:hypothetical protein
MQMHESIDDTMRRRCSFSFVMLHIFIGIRQISAYQAGQYEHECVS